MKKWLIAFLCLMLAGCTQPTPAPSSASEPVSSAPASSSAPSSVPSSPAASSLPEPQAELTAADCKPLSVPDGWEVYVSRVAFYDEADRKEIGYGGLAFAAPPGWTAFGDPLENGMYESPSFGDPAQGKLFDIMSRGSSAEPFPEGEVLGFDEKLTPREDITLEGRPVALYRDDTPTAAYGDNGPVEVLTYSYLIDSGEHRIGMYVLPRVETAEADRALAEKILLTAALTLPAKMQE